MSQAQSIIDALGGFDNIAELEPCITVDKARLQATGAHCVLIVGNVAQVVVGPNADTIADDIEDLR